MNLSLVSLDLFAKIGEMPDYPKPGLMGPLK